MIYTYVATAALFASLGLGAGWSINQWKNDANQKQAIEQAALDKQELHRLEQARSSAAIAAQVMARQSEARLRSDVASSQSALVGLQHASNEALRTAATSLEACTAISTSYSELLTASTERYQWLATKADEHLIDLRLQLETK